MHTFQLIVQGCGGVGKSALTIQFVQNKFESKYDPTIEDSYRKPFQVGNEHIMLEIIDTAGTEQFSAMRDLYMKNGHGFLLVFSLAAKSSFVELEKLRNEILQVKNKPDVPMILAANKCDLPKSEWEVAEAEVEKSTKEWKIPYLMTSAKTKHNVEQLFSLLSKQVLKDVAPPAQNTNSNRRSSSLCTLL